VLTQALAFVDAGPQTEEMIGWFQLINAEMEHQVASVALANFRRSSAAFGIATVLFLDYVFDAWPLRKVYFEVPSYNEHAMSSWANGLLRSEGRLLNRLYYMGDHVDLGIYALDASDWREFRTTPLFGT